MDYDGYTAAMQQLLTTTDASGQAILAATIGTIIQFAENMIYREPEFDFLATRSVDRTQIITAGSRTVPMAEQLIVLQEVNLITPAGAVIGTTAGWRRLRLLRTNRDFLDIIWPVVDETQTPKEFETYWAIYSEQESVGDEPPNILLPDTIIVAPTVDGSYQVEQLGIFQPEPLSATNPQTFLTAFYPDLFLAASMFFATGIVLKNFGLQADNPQQAISWKGVYDAIKTGVEIQSARQKAHVEGFSSWPSLPANIQQLQAMAAAAQQPSAQ